MNVLFALYGGLDSNSAIPLALHAGELRRRGHHCAVALPSGPEPGGLRGDLPFRPLSYSEALADPHAAFADGRPADILHAWTPREGVRRFVTAYLAKQPTPLVIYLEDNEGVICRRALSLVGFREDVLLQHTEEVITTWTPEGMAHPLRYESFIGLADAAVVIQDKLAPEVPPWVPCTTVMPGVDLELFSPRPADPALRNRYGVAASEHVIVYPGGLNAFTRPGLEALCRAVVLINRSGTPCRLLRSGPVKLDFLDELPPDAVPAISDLGALPRHEVPDLLALAEVLVQPGKPDPFEDLRLPGKLPEFFATGRPVVLPDTNIAGLLTDGEDAVFHRTGSAEEIAEKCLELLADPERARRIGEAGRRFAESHFDPKTQALRLEGAYLAARNAFDREIAAKVWTGDADSMSMPSLLARKLRLLAESGGLAGVASSPMLHAHARGIESYLERASGLETGMTVRDVELGWRRERTKSLETGIAARDVEVGSLKALVVALNEQLADREERVAELTQVATERGLRIASIEASLSWRMTRPFRSVLGLMKRLISPD